MWKRSLIFLFVFVSGSCADEAAPRNLSVHSKDLKICSSLSFENVKWAEDLSDTEKNALALALNISGSFEGRDGWKNLANNFDGQGLSLGLLNQCLGQGTLQPLMIRMRDQAGPALATFFSPADLQSLLGMLHDWQNTALLQSDVENLRTYGLSPLDEDEFIGTLRPRPPARDQKSIQWALKNVYSDRGRNFKTPWRSGLRAMAESPEYRSIQVDIALRLHQAALELFNHFNLGELRGYAFFFDVVVQNGGLPADLIKRLDSRFARAKNLTEKQKLDAILAGRLKYVKRRYVADVRSRKSAIINSGGTVHGVRRDFNREFCVNMQGALTF